MVKPSAYPHPLHTINRTPDDQRERAVRNMLVDPAWAGQLEVDSWHAAMMLDRDENCPNGEPHIIRSLRPVSGYFFLCLLCGHHFDCPF